MPSKAYQFLGSGGFGIVFPATEFHRIVNENDAYFRTVKYPKEFLEGFDLNEYVVKVMCGRPGIDEAERTRALEGATKTKLVNKYENFDATTPLRISIVRDRIDTFYTFESGKINLMLLKKLTNIKLEFKNAEKFSDIVDYNNFLFNQVISPLIDQLNKFHSNGYYHCDIKPDNIMWDETNKKAVLIDFGVAGQTDILTTNTMGGTMGYSSPGVMHYIACKCIEKNATPDLDMPLKTIINRSMCITPKDEILTAPVFFKLRSMYSHLNNVANVKKAGFNELLKRHDYFALGVALCELASPIIPMMPYKDKDKARNIHLISKTTSGLCKFLTPADIQPRVNSITESTKVTPDETKFIITRASGVKLDCLDWSQTGGVPDNNIRILGRIRKIIRKGRKQFIKYKNQIISLKEANALEKALCAQRKNLKSQSDGSATYFQQRIFYLSGFSKEQKAALVARIAAAGGKTTSSISKLQDNKRSAHIIYLSKQYMTPSVATSAYPKISFVRIAKKLNI